MKTINKYIPGGAVSGRALQYDSPKVGMHLLSIRGVICVSGGTFTPEVGDYDPDSD